VKQVKDYMASPVYVMERIEPIQRARNLMFKYDLGRIPVSTMRVTLAVLATRPAQGKTPKGGTK